MRNRGFTLIELLVVVAIIAILAAIAVPNFLEAQTRAKVSRVKSDMRTAAVAIESYRIDSNRYPWDHYQGGLNEWDTWRQVTTPIGYITTIPLDIFDGQNQPRPYDYGLAINRPNPAQIKAYTEAGFSYIYFSRAPRRQDTWAWYDNGNDGNGANLYSKAIDSSYDPTNGTVSDGLLFRAQRGLLGT